jgi:hypothetical protein
MELNAGWAHRRVFKFDNGLILLGENFEAFHKSMLLKHLLKQAFLTTWW